MSTLTSILNMRYGSTNPLKSQSKIPWEKLEFIVQEKIDGSNALASCQNNELKIACRSSEKKPNDSLFAKLFSSLASSSTDFNSKYVYCGEYVSKPRHNVMLYERAPNKLMVVWDIGLSHSEDEERRVYIRPEEMIQECTRVGLEYTPTIYHYKPDRDSASFVNPYLWSERFIEKINNPEYKQLHDWEVQLPEYKPLLGGSKIEGVVIKILSDISQIPDPEEPEKILKLSRVYKLVSPDFKERGQNKKPKDPSAKPVYLTLEDTVRNIGKTYDATPRYDKALQHLKEQSTDAKLLELIHTQQYSDPYFKEAMLEELAKDLYKEKKESMEASLFFSPAMELLLNLPCLFMKKWQTNPEDDFSVTELYSDDLVNKFPALLSSPLKREIILLGLQYARPDVYQNSIKPDVKNSQANQKNIKEYIKAHYKKELTDKLFLYLSFYLFMGASDSLETYIETLIKS